MVRLVFRPYTQVRRSICTSEPLRASTRVSSGFALLGHSSPSFGSQEARSDSRSATAWPHDSARDAPAARGRPALAPDEHLRSRYAFAQAAGFTERRPPRRTADVTQRLARLLHSLVRVSRRVSGDRLFASDLGRNAWPAPAGARRKRGAPDRDGANATAAGCAVSTPDLDRPARSAAEAADCTCPGRRDAPPSPRGARPDRTDGLYVPPGPPRRPRRRPPPRRPHAAGRLSADGYPRRESVPGGRGRSG